MAVFVLVTTFTPGPGNIASAAMGMLYGYRRSTILVGNRSRIPSGYAAVCFSIQCTFKKHSNH